MGTFNVLPVSSNSFDKNPRLIFLFSFFQPIIAYKDSDSQSGELDVTGDSISLSSKSGSTGDPDTPRVGIPHSSITEALICFFSSHIHYSFGLKINLLMSPIQSNNHPNLQWAKASEVGRVHHKEL